MKVVNYLSALMLRLVWRFSRYILPEQASYRVARLLALLAYYLLAPLRRLALSNLELALGQTTTPEERVRIAKDAFISLTTAFTELLFMEKIAARIEERVEWEGDNLIEELKAQGRGFFVFGGHFGCFTNIAVIVVRFDLPGFNVVMRPIRNPYFNQYLDYMCGIWKGKLLATRGSGEAIVNAARRGELIGLMMDQESRRKQGVFVKFFGHDACTHVVPAHLSLKYDIPLVPLWLLRIEPGRFKVIFRKPLTIQRTGDEQEDALRLTQAINDEVERTVRETPGQWLWFHDRWKRKPDGSDLYARREKGQKKKSLDQGGYLTSGDLKRKARREARAAEQKNDQG